MEQELQSGTRGFVNNPTLIIGVKWIVLVFYHEEKRVDRFVNYGYLTFFKDLDECVMIN